MHKIASAKQQSKRVFIDFFDNSGDFRLQISTLPISEEIVQRNIFLLIGASLATRLWLSAY
jgi:hypothetical protein